MEDRSETRGSRPDGDEEGEHVVRLDRIRDVLDEHPVRLAVLLGSQVTGTVDAQSDVDIAIEFEASVDDPGDQMLALLADLSVALDRNDIDLSVVDDLEPRVGRAAFTHGALLCGSAERAQTHRERFEDHVTGEQSDQSLRERFDETIDRVDRLIESGG